MNTIRLDAKSEIVTLQRATTTEADRFTTMVSKRPSMISIQQTLSPLMERIIVSGANNRYAVVGNLSLWSIGMKRIVKPISNYIMKSV